MTTGPQDYRPTGPRDNKTTKPPWRRRLLILWSCGLVVPWSLQAQPLSPLVTNSPAYQRSLWFWEQRAFPLGYIPTGARAAAVSQINEVTSQATLAGAAGPPPPSGPLRANIAPPP